MCSVFTAHLIFVPFEADQHRFKKLYIKCLDLNDTSKYTTSLYIREAHSNLTEAEDDDMIRTD